MAIGRIITPASSLRGRWRICGRPDIPVFLIRGNHDAESRLTKELRLPDNVRIFPTDKAASHRLDDLGVVVHGRGFATAAVTENLALTFPAAVPGLFNIGLLHTCATGFEGHECYAPCALSDLAAKQYDYWALGHVHVRKDLHPGEPWIVFPGNLQGRHARETGSKGASLVTVDHGCVTSIEHRGLDVVRWSESIIEVVDCNSLDDVLLATHRALEAELARAEGRLLAARIILRGACGAHSEMARKPDQFLNQIRALANEFGNVWIEKSADRNLGACSSQVRPKQPERWAEFSAQPARFGKTPLNWRASPPNSIR